MRFLADGPDIPNELLVARDRGEVIFFCGAGVSQAKAGLPNFGTLAQTVLDNLGSALDSPARKVLAIADGLERVSGVGGLMATDRIFGLLEREFLTEHVHEAVAAALKPPAGAPLDAHRALIDLATTHGVTRLVTTNFDRLFEDCDPDLRSSGPPNLPDPRSGRAFTGIVHLHGRVDPSYRWAEDEAFVISSAEYGRAYLSDAWATRFMQALLARYQIVFVGFSADDPPIQYLLEALNLKGGARSGLYAFQSGAKQDAVALWEHRGVQAIPFDPSDDFSSLWTTLEGWAARARGVDAWYDAVLDRAAGGPANLEPFVRGQVVHMAATQDGARRLAGREPPIDGSWVLAFDAGARFTTPFRIHEDPHVVFDPFTQLGLDSDEPPPPPTPENRYESRTTPAGALDPFVPTRPDVEALNEKASPVGLRASEFEGSPLSPRLGHLATWLGRVAHQPVVLWWAAEGAPLHLQIQQGLTHALDQSPERFSPEIAKGWRLLLAKWADRRPDSNFATFALQNRVERSGWSEAAVRDYVAVFKPHVTVHRAFSLPHPMRWSPEDQSRHVVGADVDYPTPHQRLDIPDALLAYAVRAFRGDLELAVSLETEQMGVPELYLETTLDADGETRAEEDAYALTGPVVRFQALMARYAAVDPDQARAEALSWPRDDNTVFTRLRLWAAGQSFLSGADAGAILTGLSDRVFWGSQQERELLFALKVRWADLSVEYREDLQHRLATGSFDWSPEIRGGPAAAAAYNRLSRIHWLAAQGVALSLDLPTFMAAQRALAPDWEEAAGDHVADSNAAHVVDIQQDDDAGPLLETPLAEVVRGGDKVGHWSGGVMRLRAA